MKHNKHINLHFKSKLLHFFKKIMNDKSLDKIRIQVVHYVFCSAKLKENSRIRFILMLICYRSKLRSVKIFNQQYSSQIVETGAICLEFSPNFLHSLLTPLFSLKCAPLLPQCWATRILEHWDDCNTQINIGEGENHTRVSRFVTSIVSWFSISFVS